MQSMLFTILISIKQKQTLMMMPLLSEYTLSLQYYLINFTVILLFPHLSPFLFHFPFPFQFPFHFQFPFRFQFPFQFKFSLLVLISVPVPFSVQLTLLYFGKISITVMNCRFNKTVIMHFTDAKVIY